MKPEKKPHLMTQTRIYMYIHTLRVTKDLNSKKEC